MKNILDTVHGQILLKEEYLNKIIDTPEFQRLRRIEQSPIRSVYPSARHDRFIHSLGVYHIGQMIVNQLETERTEWNIDVDFEAIAKSYLLACLLHDVGHSPFSHTLEKFYGKKKYLAKVLSDEINNDYFTKDLTGKEKEANFHEYVSAWLAVKRFSDEIVDLGGNPEFVARMIIGLFYQDKSNYQIENCMISLLHGEVIDSDRLDYTCRDVWASGYHTSSYDLKRLISALHIRKKEDNGDFVVCFDCNVINEIDNVMTIKDFQMKYVFNHHTVVYDQYLLASAVEHTAYKWFGDEFKDKYKDNCDVVSAATGRLCSIESMIEPLEIGTFKLVYPSDGDFVSLMKQDDDNKDFEEWYSRKYSRFAIWKTPDEFAGFFKIRRNKTIENENFENAVSEVLISNGIDSKDILIRRVVYKSKVLLKSLYILVHNELKRFTDLYPEEGAMKDIVFYYVFVRKPNESSQAIEIERQRLIKVLLPVMRNLYPEYYNDEVQ